MKNRMLMALAAGFLGLAVWLFLGEEIDPEASGETPAPMRKEKAAHESAETDDARKQLQTSRSADRSLARDFKRRMDAAKKVFEEKDIPAALAELGKAAAIHPDNPRMLNLRGSCHVELRDFDLALADFQKAAEVQPHDPTIRFNVAEVFFVTKRWEEALATFEKLREELTNPTIIALADFKILLCNHALGRDDEFRKGILAARDDAGSPSPYYMRAAGAIHSGDPAGARRELEAAKQRFPDAGILAPWNDTLVEFGWLVGFP